VTTTTTSVDPIAEVKAEIARHSAELVRIDSELKRLQDERSNVQAKFNFECHRLGMFKQREAVTR